MPTPINQLLSRTLYATDGSTTEWDFSFSGGYISKSHVKALVEAPSGARTDVVVTEDMLTGPYTLRITPALAAGDVLTIYRDTPKDLPLVDFTDESGFSEVSLDTSAKQAVFIAAETVDTVNTSSSYDAEQAAAQAATSAALADSLADGAALAALSATNSANAATVSANAALAASEDAEAYASTAALAVSTLENSLVAPTGASLIGYLPAGTGAVATTVQNKLRESVTASGFPDLATAIAAFGSTKTNLVINSPVNVSADLTIPENVSVRVEGLGLITVAAGKRLFINGSFSAPKLHKCFSAPLLTTAITASVSGMTLIVTAVSNAVLASGHVVTGGGLEEGVTIAQDLTIGGAGTYTLNGDWGAIASTTFTVTGASVIFGAGAVDRVYPQWFGAEPDAGTTDNTDAIRHSVYSQPWGGKVSISAGNYKVTNSTVLHGGISIEGDGVVDISTGSPSPNETGVPSYIWQATDNKAIWVVPVRADRVAIRHLSHGASAAPTGVAPIGAGRRGILFNGRAPQFVYAPDIENCYFFHLARGIDVNDSLAASATNWGVNPGLVRSCHFVYCAYGIVFYTDNADAWRIDQGVFILPANGSGVHLLRCGFLKLDTCFAFGGYRANSEFIKIAPIETGNPIDTVTIDNCQAEACSHFLIYDGANTRQFDINMRSCILQDGADIYLGNLCTLNSTNNHLMASVYYDAANIKINSINDWFEFQNFVSGATWGFVNAGAGDANTIHTYIPGGYPSSALGQNTIVNAWNLNNEPNVQTGNSYAIVNSDVTVIADHVATMTLVFPFGYLQPGRKIRVITRKAQAVISSQANIIPLSGGATTTAILPAVAGKWADLESDGTYWAITASN